MQAWKATNAYAIWAQTPHPALMEIEAGHLLSGQLSMSDVKLKLSQLTQYVSAKEDEKLAFSLNIDSIYSCFPYYVFFDSFSTNI